MDFATACPPGSWAMKIKLGTLGPIVRFSARMVEEA